MTDIIKGLEMVDSKLVLKHLKAHPDLIEENVEKFREELRDLESSAPTILAFGELTHTKLSLTMLTAGNIQD